MADFDKLANLRASLRREESKLVRQNVAINATNGLISILKKEIELEEKKR